MDENQSINNDKRSLKELHPVQNYFDFDAVDNVSKCKVASCNHTVNGRHSNNLSRHFERNHRKLYDELNSDINEYRNEKKKLDCRRQKLIMLP